MNAVTSLLIAAAIALPAVEVLKPAPAVSPAPREWTHPEATPRTAFELNLHRTLARGSRGADVLALQRFLQSQQLLAPDAATGFYGALTERAIKTWQQRAGIVSTGTPQTTGYGAVGPKTRRALMAAAMPTSANANPNSTPGSVYRPFVIANSTFAAQSAPSSGSAQPAAQSTEPPVPAAEPPPDTPPPQNPPPPSLGDEFTITCEPDTFIDQQFISLMGQARTRASTTVRLSGERCLTRGLSISGLTNVTVTTSRASPSRLVLQRDLALSCGLYAARTLPLYVYNSDRITIENLVIDANVAANRLPSGALCAPIVGLRMDGTRNSRISNVQVIAPSLHGIALIGSSDNTISGARIEDWGNFGIILFNGSSNNTITDSRLIASRPQTSGYVAGIVVDDESSSNLSPATSCRDTAHPSNSNQIKYNRIEGVSGVLDVGILVEGSDSNIVDGNTITGSKLHGIAVESSQFQGAAGGADHNIVVRNVITAELEAASEASAILIRGSNNNIASNTIRSHGGRAALYFDGPAVKLLPLPSVSTTPPERISYSYGCPYVLGTEDDDPQRDNFVSSNTIEHRSSPALRITRARRTFLTGNTIRAELTQAPPLQLVSELGSIETTIFRGNTFSGDYDTLLHLEVPSPTGANITTVVLTDNVAPSVTTMVTRSGQLERIQDVRI